VWDLDSFTMEGKLLNGRPGLEKVLNLTDKTIRVTWINENTENGVRLVSLI
jgi:hypothetical protein